MKIITIVGVIVISIFLNLEYRISETSISKFSYEDFMPTKFEDGILYASRKSDKPFGKLYFSKIEEKELLGEPIKIQLPANRRFYNLVPGEYNKESGEFYFTSNNPANLSGIYELAIYKGKIEHYELIELERLKFCNTGYSYAHPTLSNNGLRMILSSDEKGEHNLYLYERKSFHDDWKLKRSLDEINTEDYDACPKLLNDSSLVFTSYGKEQSASLNFLKSNLNTKTDKWNAPIQLDYLNSEDDDYGITFISQTSGYLSSNRNGSNSIFYFEKEK